MDHLGEPRVDEEIFFADDAVEPRSLALFIKRELQQHSISPVLVAEEIGLTHGWFHKGTKVFPKWHQLKRLAEITQLDLVIICGYPRATGFIITHEPQGLCCSALRPSPKYGVAYVPYNGDDTFARQFLKLLVDDILEEEGAEDRQERAKAYNARIDGSVEISFPDLDTICRELDFVLRFCFSAQ